MRLDLHKLTNVKLLKVHKKKEKKLKPKKCKSRSDKAGRRGKFGIMSRLILITLGPAVILAIILGVFSLNILTDGMRRQAYDGLESVAESVAAAYNTADSGPYYLNGQNLVKGSLDLTTRGDVIDNFAASPDLDISIYYGNICYATSLKDETTGERLLYTEADSKIVQKVIKNAKVYTEPSVSINGNKYCVTYSPLYGNNGNVIGMLFVGRQQETIDEYIDKKLSLLVMIEICLIILAALIGLFFSRKIANIIRISESSIRIMSSGDLSKSTNMKLAKRTDECGSMVRSLEELRKRMVDIISNVVDTSNRILEASSEVDVMTNQTSNAMDEISRAVEDISHGAIGQADEVEEANTQMMTMGGQMDDISKGVELLDVASSNMKGASRIALNIMDELSGSTDRTTNAISKISEQIRLTNKSVAEIKNAVAMITEIASQTNLLSLNASIEAARAGEQGKGFAVVASEIQKLSDQSNNSAVAIGDIISELGRESEETVRVMNQVEEIVKEQQDKLVETKQKFNAVEDGINESRCETQNIKECTNVCGQSKIKIVDVMSNLSSLSEENAASSEETTASIQEVNANMNQLAQSSVNLKDQAEKLVTAVGYFKL